MFLEDSYLWAFIITDCLFDLHWEVRGRQVMTRDRRKLRAHARKRKDKPGKVMSRCERVSS